MTISSKSVKKLKEQFLGQNVIVYLKDMNVVTVNEEGQELNITAMTEAHVVDIDQNYFYMGLPDGTITRIIQHEIAGMVELAFDQDAEMQLPTDEDDVH